MRWLGHGRPPARRPPPARPSRWQRWAAQEARPRDAQQTRRAETPAADVSTFYGSPSDDTDPVTGLVCCATGAGKLMAGVFPPGAKPRRFAPLCRHVLVAARLSFTDAAVLRASSDVLTGIGKLQVLAGYEPPDESVRLAAGRARPLRHRRDGDSQAVAGIHGTGERW